MTVKTGKLGCAFSHASYIAREGQYKHYTEKGEQLEASTSGNMPSWSAHNPLEFWKAADSFERKNGSTYREHEIALPRELNSEQRQALVQDWIEQEINDKYPYQYAIHVPKAADGKEQPHVHLMFSERIMDGIERDPDQHFKRYNSKYPERGGAKKDNTGLKHSERKEKLLDQRQRWETLCNQHLEQAGLTERIDMRSYKEQGKDQQPEPKYRPSEWRKHKAQIIELREAVKAQQQAQLESKGVIKNPEATLIDLQQEKQQRLKKQIEEKAEASRKQFEKERLERIRQQQREKEEEQRRLQSDPDHIKKVFDSYLKEEEHYRNEQLKQYDKTLATTDKAHNQLFRARPERPQGFFARFKEGRYQKDLATWEAKEREANNERIQAERTKEDFSQSNNPSWKARQRFSQDHPEMAKNRERLEKEALEKRMEAILKEYEQKRARERGRGSLGR